MCFESGRFLRMRINKNVLQVRVRFDERRDTAVARWARRWNHWAVGMFLCIGVLARSRIFCSYASGRGLIPAGSGQAAGLQARTWGLSRR